MTTRSALITRKQLNPYEEARAVKAMIDRALTENGAAQALGWHKARVSARLKLLELPERGQQLIGTGVIPLGAVDQLRVIGTAAPALLDAVIAFIDDGNDWAAERLTREPGWVLDAAISDGSRGCFAAYLHSASPHEIAELRLGKRAEAQLAAAERLHKQIDRYAYGPPTIRFTDADIDQARAAGVLIEFEQARPIIVDRPLYRELVKAALKAHRRRPHRQSGPAGRAQAADQARRPGRPRPAHHRKAATRRPAARARRPGTRRQPRPRRQPADRPLDRQPGRHGRGALLRLRAARPDHDGSPYTHGDERVRQLAAGGIRLIVDELRSDVTKTRKDGTRGRLRIDYGNPNEPKPAITWLWKFLDAAKTPGELYGRALVIIAAEQCAARLVLPASQRGHHMRWNSHKQLAAKALKKLATPHLPATLTQLDRAVKRADHNHTKAENAHHQRQRDTKASDGTGERSAPSGGHKEA